MIKKILLGLLALIVVIVVLVLIGFILPGQLEMTRSATIGAPPEYVFEEVNNLENWGRWSYWNTLDPEMKTEFGEMRSGAGSSYTWDGPEVGKGKLTITESEPFSSIKCDLDFMEQGTAKAWYTFEQKGDSTLVTMGFLTDFGMNPIGRWMGPLILKPEMEKAFDYNLEKLKELAESKPRFLVNIEEEQIAPIHYVGISHTMSPKDMEAVSKEMGRMYGKLEADLKKAKVQSIGVPFCIYTSYSEESMDMECAMPVAAGTSVPKYEVKEIPAGKVLKVVHRGAYEGMDVPYTELDKYVNYKKLTLNGGPWEVFITDPTVESDTSMWVTEIYYPVK